MSLIDPAKERQLRTTPRLTAPGSAPGTNYAPQPYSRRPSYFQPRTSPAGLPGSNAAYGRQAGLLGPGWQQVLSPTGEPLKRQDVSLLELGLNLQNLERAEEDRARGFEELARGRSAVGQDPASALAREMAMRRVMQGNDLKTQRGAALKDRTAVATQDALRSLQEEQARSGSFSGSGAYLDRAMLPQRAAIELSGQLSDLDFMQEDADRAALGQLDQIGAREAAQLAAFDELLANIFLQTERGPIDLSGLLEELPKKKGQTVI